jgi:hypothetical protein
MKKITLLFLLFWFLFQITSIGQITFEKKYPFTTYIYAEDVVQLDDGGYILLGDSVIRTDANGNKIWTKANTYYSSFIERANDGNFLTGGNKLAKMDEDWNEIWSYSVSGVSHVIETTDNCYVVAAGYSMKKLSSTGAVIWTTPSLNYPTFTCDLYKTIETPDSGYVVVGTYTGSNWDQQAMVVKTNKQGTILWNKKYGSSAGNYSQEGMDLINTSDGNIVFAGNTGLPGWLSVYIVKLNQSGTVITSKTYEGNADGWSGANGIVQTSDGGYAITGWTTYYGSGIPNYSNVLMMKVNSSLVKQWHRYWGGSSDDTGVNLRITSDGGFVIGGTADNQSSNSSLYLIKTNSMGQVGINENMLNENFTLFPNPNAGTFTVEFPPISQNKASFKIIDMTGRIVLEDDLEKDNLSFGSATITLSQIQDGFYTLLLTTDQLYFTKKISVVH